MTTRRVLMAVVALFSLVAAQEHQPAQRQAVPEFDKLKTLAGNWAGTYNGPAEPPKTGNVTMPVKANFRAVSNGTAVVLTSDGGTDQEMITVFHPDGASLMATHYCSIGNQPRMRMVPSSDPNKLVFKFSDITNLAPTQPGHIKDLTITFLGPDHHVEEWTSVAAGKEAVARFDMRRVK